MMHGGLGTKSLMNINSVRDLIPITVMEVNLNLECAVVVKRIRDMIKADSLVFVSYWSHKGDFVGSMSGTHFRIRRFVRDFYVPLILGRVVPRDGHSCCVSLRFLSLDALVFLAMIIILAIMARQALGLAAVFGCLASIGHVKGCSTHKAEIDRFLSAVRE